MFGSHCTCFKSFKPPRSALVLVRWVERPSRVGMTPPMAVKGRVRILMTGMPSWGETRNLRFVDSHSTIRIHLLYELCVAFCGTFYSRRIMSLFNFWSRQVFGTEHILWHLIINSINGANTLHSRFFNNIFVKIHASPTSSWSLFSKIASIWLWVIQLTLRLTGPHYAC